MDATKLLDALRLSARALFGVALAAGIVLFSPIGLVEFLGLAEFRAVFHPWIGGAFVVSSSLFVSGVLAELGGLVYPALLERWNARQWAKDLHELSPPEKERLARFVEADSTTQTFHISDGVIGGLVAKKILFRSSNLGRPGSLSFDYNVQPWAWRYLKNNPDLLAPRGE